MIEHFNSATANDGLGDALFGDDANYDDFEEAVNNLEEEDGPKLLEAWNDAFEKGKAGN